MRFHLATVIGVVVSSLMLTACGGGGGGTPSNATPVTTFPLQTANKNYTKLAKTENYAVTGSCNGTYSSTTTATTPATFEGVSGFAADETEIYNLPDCKINLQESSTNYYDSNYSPIGASVPNNIYTKFQSLPTPLPDAAKVGDAGDFETLITYLDNTKTTISAKLVVSYAVLADTPSTTSALVNFTTKHFNETNQLQSTTVYQYRIGSDGSMVPLSFSIQNNVGTDSYLFKKQ